MRLTIERMRTLVLAAAVLLLVALVGFLAVARWKNPFSRRDLPQRLGLNIQQEANGWTYTHEQRGHTLYKIHAAKLVQMKKGSNVLLHDVKIELYGEDGSRTDRIEGSEFEYDPKGGTAKATGEVEITLMRPGVAPAIAPKATPGAGLMPKGSALASAAQTAASGEIHVKTSGLTFDQKSGIASTAEHVEFSLKQGSGSAVGASYNSSEGVLVLDHAVELNTKRGDESVSLRAQHAEFDRDDLVCSLRAAVAGYRGGEAAAGQAKILFRDDGSAVRLDATNGFTMKTPGGGHLAAPVGLLEFNEHNQPVHGHLQGGVVMDSATNSVSAGNQTGLSREIHTTSPTAELQFSQSGELRHAHLERGVDMRSVQRSELASAGGPLTVNRAWASPTADIDFRTDRRGDVQPERIRGEGGVVVAGQSQRGSGPISPSRFSADQITGEFGDGSALTAMVGTGHASMEQTTVTGTRQTTSGDRLEAHFGSGGTQARGGLHTDLGGSGQIETATVDGHVVLIEQRPARPGIQAEMTRATAGRAVYEGAGQQLHLTMSPRVEDGGLQLTADKIDVLQSTGDAFARGDVKATWMGSDSGTPSSSRNQAGSVSLGGQGPAHVIATEAQIHQATGEATFRGKARMWQQANSIAAPVIVLDRLRRTLTAHCTDSANPVRLVLLSAGGAQPGGEAARKDSGPSVIRVRGGDLKYSDAERKAVIIGGLAGIVVAETATATTFAGQVDLILLPAGNHAGREGSAAQVDRMVARGRVNIASEGRHGTGEQLVYTGENAEYVLTGTSASPPRITDPAHGTVTGEALIFHGRDDSVSVEGGGRKTLTQTLAPK